MTPKSLVLSLPWSFRVFSNYYYYYFAFVFFLNTYSPDVPSLTHPISTNIHIIYIAYITYICIYIFQIRESSHILFPPHLQIQSIPSAAGLAYEAFTVGNKPTNPIKGGTRRLGAQ